MKWEPTSAEMMKAMLAVLLDKEAATDCLFWHGSPTDSARQTRAQAGMIAHLDRTAWFGKVIINGLTGGTCNAKNLCYPGAEIFRAALVSLGVNDGDIIEIPPANHTAAESEALLKLMKDREWNSVAIVSQPHHQLRCFLQIIASMKKLGIPVAAYNRTPRNVDWYESLKKPVLGGGEIDGTLADHVAAENERITKYADPTGTDYSLNATIPEMFEYLKTRDSIE